VLAKSEEYRQGGLTPNLTTLTTLTLNPSTVPSYGEPFATRLLCLRVYGRLCLASRGAPATHQRLIKLPPPPGISTRAATLSLRMRPRALASRGARASQRLIHLAPPPGISDARGYFVFAYAAACSSFARCSSHPTSNQTAPPPGISNARGYFVFAYAAACSSLARCSSHLTSNQTAPPPRHL